MPTELQTAALPRKILRLIKELKAAKAELVKEKDKFGREMLRAQAHDLAAKLAWELIECDRYEESYVLARTLSWRTNAKDRYLSEGTSLTHLKRCGEAKALLEEGVREYPEFVPLLVSLGNCYMRLAEHSKALECQERALRLDPRNPKILFNKAADLYNLGFYEDSREILLKMLRKRPRDPWCHSLAGHCYNQIGYPEDARKHFLKSIECGYRFADAYAGLYRSYYDQGMRSDGISAAINGIQKYPDQDSEIYRDLAFAYYEMGWMKEACDVIRKGIEIFPDDAELKEWLENFENDMNDPDQGDEIEKPKILLVLDDRMKRRILR